MNNKVLTGRAAQREQTRTRLLAAVLDIIVAEGMRAVRHRAVAQRAGVSLGSTTYHFSSIEELIVSAFEHWRASIPLVANPFFQQLTRLLQAFDTNAVSQELKTDAAARRELVDRLCQLSVDYVCDQLTAQRQDRIIELAFYHESQRFPPLRELVMQSWQAELDYLAQVHQVAGSAQPAQDAWITLALFRQLEQQAVISGSARPDRALIEATLTRHMTLCFAIA